jgi:hypothetical protein
MFFEVHLSTKHATGHLCATSDSKSANTTPFVLSREEALRNSRFNAGSSASDKAAADDFVARTMMYRFHREQP